MLHSGWRTASVFRIAFCAALAGFIVLLSGSASPSESQAAGPVPEGRIVYSWAEPGANNQNGQFGIASIRPDGSDRRDITPVGFQPGSGYAPVGWVKPSPDGSRYAFTVSNPPPRFDLGIYMANGDGTSPVKVVDGDVSGPLTWSPDGTRLAYLSGGARRISVYTLADQTVTSIPAPDTPLNDSERLVTPTWSQDGTEIAYIRQDPTRSSAVVAQRIDSSATRTLATGDGSGAQRLYDWSPDGRWLLTSPSYNAIARLATDGSGTLENLASMQPHSFVGAAFGPNASTFAYPDHNLLVSVDGTTTALDDPSYKVTWVSWIQRTAPASGDTALPSITISAPADGAVFTLGQRVDASYSCSDGGSGVATCDGPVPSGSPIATVHEGRFTFTVSASDRAGNATTRTVSYEVQGTSSGGTPIPNPNDQLTFAKGEANTALDAGQTRTLDVACPSGTASFDGSTLVQAVDQGTGRLTDVQTLSAARSSDGYSFVVANRATGRAQVKAFVSCLSRTSSQGGTLSFAAPATAAASVPDAGRDLDLTVTCPSSAIAVAPAYTLEAASGRLIASEPTPDGTGWRFAIVAPGGTRASVSAACLSAQLSSGMRVVRTVAQTSTTGGTDQVSAARVDLPVGYAGVAAGFRTNAGASSLGHEPQDRSVIFSVLGPGSTDLTVVGLGLTTEQPPGPADAGSAAAPATSSVDQARASARNDGFGKLALVGHKVVVTQRGLLRLPVSCAAASICQGTAILQIGKVAIGKTRFAVRAGRRAVNIRLAPAGQRRLRRTGYLLATLTITAGTRTSRTGLRVLRAVQ